MAYCHRCGTAIEVTQQYCNSCGARLPTSDHPDVVSSFAGRTALNVLIGAAISFVLGIALASLFMPLYVFALLLGGGIAGYLQSAGTNSGTWIGAVCGFVASIPFLLLAVLGTIVGAAWFALHQGDVAMPDPIGIGIISAFTVFMMLLGITGNVILGALGGFAGATLHDVD